MGANSANEQDGQSWESVAEVATVPVRIKNLIDAEVLEAQLIELSIVGNSFLCQNAARHVLYM
jgi:hypothetical protein